MTRSTDLGERIARLERLLDSIEQTRRGEKPAPADREGEAPVDRIRELTSLLQERVAVSGMDEADGIAMRALVAEYRLTLGAVHGLTAELAGHLRQVSDESARISAALRSLEQFT